jgi:hypothetical protein
MRHRFLICVVTAVLAVAPAVADTSSALTVNPNNSLSVNPTTYQNASTANVSTQINNQNLGANSYGGGVQCQSPQIALGGFGDRQTSGVGLPYSSSGITIQYLAPVGKTDGKSCRALAAEILKARKLDTNYTMIQRCTDFARSGVVLDPAVYPELARACAGVRLANAGQTAQVDASGINSQQAPDQPQEPVSPQQPQQLPEQPQDQQTTSQTGAQPRPVVPNLQTSQAPPVNQPISQPLQTALNDAVQAGAQAGIQTRQIAMAPLPAVAPRPRKAHAIHFSDFSPEHNSELRRLAMHRLQRLALLEENSQTPSSAPLKHVVAERIAHENVHLRAVIAEYALENDYLHRMLKQKSHKQHNALRDRILSYND